MATKTKLAITIFGLLAAIAIGCYTPMILAIAFSFWAIILFGTISFLTGLWHFGIRRTGGQARSWLLPTAKITAFLVLLSVVLVASAFIQQSYKEKATRDYACRIDPALEAWKLKNGRYPAKLEEVENLPRAPRLVHWEDNYSIDRDGQSWSLSYSDGCFGFWFYDSQTKTWICD
jgi:hypothetical protein